jgi:hypothetical protein
MKIRMVVEVEVGDKSLVCLVEPAAERIGDTYSIDVASQMNTPLERASVFNKR